MKCSLSHNVFSNLRKIDAHAVHKSFNIKDINIKTAVHKFTNPIYMVIFATVT